MNRNLLLLISIICILGFVVYACGCHAEDKKPVDILSQIQGDALKKKDNKDYVAGFCAGIRAANWEEAAQHGWAGIPADALMPPKITFPDKTVFTCKEK